MQEILLSNTRLEVGVLPDLGATLSFLKLKRGNEQIDILRPIDLKKEKLDSNNAALFPMVPYCGRIRGGSFTYWGILRKVPKNQSGITEPIHGDGWKSTWTIKEKTNSSLTLMMKHTKKDFGFPFDYEAELKYELQDSKLVIQITLRNPAPLPMPYGLGIHPFFVKDKDILLNFKTQTVWSNESDPIFDEPYATPTAWNFEGGKPLKNAVFDTCFGGFDGKAQIIYPSKNIQISISAGSAFRHIVLYAPKGKNFFCLEPTSNASNAFNLAADGVIGTGIRSIGPKQSITDTFTLDIQG